MRLFIFLALLLGIGASFAAEDKSRFDCSLPIAEGSQSIRALSLTEEVYRCARQTAHRDLIVVNGLNQRVPFRIAPARDKNTVTTTHRDLSIYQEPVAVTYKTSEQIRRFTLLTGINPKSDAYQDWKTSNAYYSSIILKNDIDDEALESIQIRFRNPSGAPIKATVLLESSNDLQTWTVSSNPQSLLYLDGANGGLLRDRLLVGSHRHKKYLRLASLSNIENFNQLIGQVTGTYRGRSSLQAEIQWLELEAGSFSPLDNQQGWQLSLDTLAPISQIRMHANNSIVFYSGSIYAQRHPQPAQKLQQDGLRNKQKQKAKTVLKQVLKGEGREPKQAPIYWRHVSRFKLFEFQTSTLPISDVPIEFVPQQSKQWRFNFEQPTEILAQQLPTIAFGWKPSQLKFIAQGPEPFRLLVGSDEAIAPASHLQFFQPDNSEIEPVTLLGVERAETQDNARADPAIAEQTFNWYQILLWGVLLAGVGLMVFMAVQLSKKMSAGNS